MHPLAHRSPPSPGTARQAWPVALPPPPLANRPPRPRFQDRGSDRVQDRHQPALPGSLGGMAWARPAAGTPEADAFAIGWAHARLGCPPPDDLMAPGQAMHQGWVAGRQHHGPVAAPAPAPQQRWLALRLHAWRRGLRFDAGQVNARHLADLQVSRCPVLRQPLSAQAGDPLAATVDRLNDAVGYVPGHLVVMSHQANRAKGCLRWQEARDNAELARARDEAPGTGQHNGLNADAWERLAALMALVTPLPHPVAAGLPLRVLPPRRLRLVNPIQALQALLTRQLMRAGYAERIAQWVAVLPGPLLRRDFQLFFHTLLAHSLRGGRAQDPVQLRDRLEDAWAHQDVLRRWQRFATALSAQQAAMLLDQAVTAGLGGPVLTHAEPECEADAWWDTGAPVAAKLRARAR